MADLWFRKFGFSRNPFTIKPAAFSYELFGANIEGVLSGVEDGRLLFVEAPLGYGKTTLLKSIIHRFGGRRKVIYAHALPSEQLDVKGLLKRSSVASFITGSLPSSTILVVDEAQNILPEGSAEILEFYKGGNIRAAVFFGTDYSKNSFVSELETALNGNVIRLSKPTPEQAVSLVRSRIGNLSLVSNGDIQSAYRKAQGSPRRLLQICEDICRAAAEGRSEPVSVAAEEPELKAEKPKRKAKKASKLRRKRAIVRKVVQSPRAVPEHFVEVSSTSPVGVSDVAVEKSEPKIKLRLKKPVAAAKKAKPANEKRPRRKSRQKAKDSLPVAAPSPSAEAESSEGKYWGEFMGMQK